jgi:hypothetical protein
MLLEEIIRRKKLRVTNVSTHLYLGDRETCELGTNASSLEAFCILFLGKRILPKAPIKLPMNCEINNFNLELAIPDSMMNDYDLAINKLEIYEHPEDIGIYFLSLLYLLRNMLNFREEFRSNPCH